jgi:predicted RNase H-like nuclease (RuvC/YqgF family)
MIFGGAAALDAQHYDGSRNRDRYYSSSHSRYYTPKDDRGCRHYSRYERKILKEIARNEKRIMKLERKIHKLMRHSHHRGYYSRGSSHHIRHLKKEIHQLKRRNYLLREQLNPRPPYRPRRR